jgi:RNA polymerase sigma-70 factor, ECF subfamily
VSLLQEKKAKREKYETVVTSKDDQKFRTLYATYGGQVLGFLTRLCDGNRAEAEDLTQETFIAAYENRQKFGGFGSQKAWLFGIALRRWRDSHRRIRPETGHEETERETTNGFEEQAITRLTVQEALQTLAPEARAALLLIADQQMTYREAAQVLGEPIGTVKWRVFEAMKTLRGLLREESEKEINMGEKGMKK